MAGQESRSEYAQQGEAQHTPGPWMVDGDLVRDPDEYVIAQAWAYYAPGREGQQDANARLIAAAPDLLAALVSASALFCDDGEACRFCDADIAQGEEHDPDATCSEMIAAIDKARGQ